MDGFSSNHRLELVGAEVPKSSSELHGTNHAIVPILRDHRYSARVVSNPATKDGVRGGIEEAH